MTIATEPTTAVLCPAPGIFPDIPAELYHQWPACSFSRLRELRRSPAHCQVALQERSRTDAMILGEAVHFACLQPDLFESRYAVAGQCEAVLKSGDRKGEQCSSAGSVIDADGHCWCKTHKPRPFIPDTREVLTGNYFNIAGECRASINKADGLAKALLDADGESELSIVWDDLQTGVRCKGRIDKRALEMGIKENCLVDLKTTVDARRDAFERKIYGLGYHLQAGMYLNAADVLGLNADSFAMIAMEKAAPFAHRVYRLQDDVVAAGLAEARKLMLTWSRCVESNVWPSYPDDMLDLGLPAWDWKQLNESDK